MKISQWNRNLPGLLRFTTFSCRLAVVGLGDDGQRGRSQVSPSSQELHSPHSGSTRSDNLGPWISPSRCPRSPETGSLWGWAHMDAPNSVFPNSCPCIDSSFPRGGVHKGPQSLSVICSVQTDANPEHVLCGVLFLYQPWLAGLPQLCGEQREGQGSRQCR